MSHINNVLHYVSVYCDVDTHIMKIEEFFCLFQCPILLSYYASGAHLINTISAFALVHKHLNSNH